jgi:hypothetical protein
MSIELIGVNVPVFLQILLSVTEDKQVRIG